MGVGVGGGGSLQARPRGKGEGKGREEGGRGASSSRPRRLPSATTSRDSDCVTCGARQGSPRRFQPRPATRRAARSSWRPPVCSRGEGGGLAAASAVFAFPCSERMGLAPSLSSLATAQSVIVHAYSERCFTSIFDIMLDINIDIRGKGEEDR